MARASDPRILVMCGNAINCDEETAFAVEQAGGKPERVLAKSLLTGKKSVDNYDGIIVPGGFSYGDYVAAGKLLAKNFQNHLPGQIGKFIDSEKLVWGICNGFQFLTCLGLDDEGIDYGNTEPKTTLIANKSGKFRDDWVYLGIDPDSKCIITKGINRIGLSIRHGEGNFYTASETIEALKRNGQVAMRYVGPNGEENPGWPDNPNGSSDNIAGICDPTGRALGLMPHPEVGIRPHHYPTWTRNRAEAEENAEKAMQMFKNFVDYLRC